MCHKKLMLSLLFFCWCLLYKRPAVISQHAWVPFAAVSFLHSGCILMQTFTVLVKDGSHISREKIQARLQEMDFQ